MTAKRCPPLPKRLRIGHATYTVEANTKASRAADSEGSSDCNDLHIYLRSDRPHDAQADTFLHEVLHQALAVSGAPAWLKVDLEERIVRAMTSPLLGALRDNPGFVDFLLHQE